MRIRYEEPGTMNLLGIKGEAFDVQFSLDELLVVSNALNEVCNGIDVPEFHARIGASPMRHSDCWRGSGRSSRARQRGGRTRSGDAISLRPGWAPYRRERGPTPASSRSGPGPTSPSTGRASGKRRRWPCRHCDAGHRQPATGRIHPGLQRREAEGFEHLLPAAQAGVLGLDGGEDRLALGLGQPLPGGAELGLAGLVARRSRRGRGCCSCALGLGRRPSASRPALASAPRR